MKNILLISLINLAFFINLNAQINLKVKPLNLNNSKKLNQQLKPIITQIGDKKIVALGEGTHGTKEFNELRITMIKQLIEQKGFTIICFENPYGDSHFLNQIINSEQDIHAGLRQYSISLWQTKEIENFLLWLRTYNKSHKNKVEFMGIDFNFITNSTKIIRDEFNTDTLLQVKSQNLYNFALYQDTEWEKQNDSTAKIDFEMVLKNGAEGYKIVQIIDSILHIRETPISNDLQKALLNCKHGFDMLYNGFLQKEGTPRDKLMAEMVTCIANQNKKSKMIVWVHAAHAAFKPTYKNDNGGGMGGYLREKFGTGFYSLGTTTANGTYSATKDNFDTRSNLFSAYTLTKPLKDSWENLFSENQNVAFFIAFKENISSIKLKWRPIGYVQETPACYSDEIKLSDYFDGLIFVRNTTASVHNQ